MVKEEKKYTRRVRSAYIVTTISLTLVLFMLGLEGLLVINAKKLSDFVKENVNFTIIFSSDANEADILQLKKQLDAMTYVKTAEYIDAEKAAKEFSEQLGEDFISVLGYNPLQSSIEVKLHAQYANLQYFNIIEKKLKKNPVVEEIIYEKSLIHLLNENIRKISIVILGFTAIFFLIAVWLINNNVRLMVYSRRFIIRTMQLVGATRGFIRRPFLVNSIFQGFIAGILANVMIIGIIYFTNQELKEINLMIDIKIMYVLISFIILLAIFINLVSTFFAVNKYLNISTDNLYAL